MRYADIVLPLAQPLYTFAVAEGVTLCEGMAVVVPFGRSKIYTGIVWLLHERFKAEHVDYQLSIGEDMSQVRFHFFLTTEFGVEDTDLKSLEADVAALTRTWDDLLEEALRARFGESKGQLLADCYRGAFNDAYKACNSPAWAAEDVGRAMNGPKIVVNKSTVPLGAHRMVRD